MKNIKLRVILAVVVTLVLAGSLLFTAQIEKALGLTAHIETEDFTSNSDLANDIEVVKQGEAVIHFIDVGQGDATLIELPSETSETDDGGRIPGTFVLIDGGSDSSNYQARGDNGELKLMNYLDQRVGDIQDFVFDYVILTHPHEDHCGGLNNVLEKYPSKVVYRPNARSTNKTNIDPILANDSSLTSDEKFFGTHDAKNAISTKTYWDFLSAAYTSRFQPSGVTKKVYVTDANNTNTNKIKGSAVYEEGVKRSIGISDSEYFEFRFYTPTKAEYSDVNDYSPILILDFNDKRVVLTGDAEIEAEREFSTAYSNNTEFKKSADIVAAGHHGSRTSTSATLLDVVSPKGTNEGTLFVISCGMNNSYGHPHSELTSRIAEYGFKPDNILRTDIHGDVVISFVPDTEGEGYVMMFGASVIRSVVEPPVPIRWWHIVLGVWVVCIIVIFAYGNKGINLKETGNIVGLDLPDVVVGKKTTTTKKSTAKKSTSTKSTTAKTTSSKTANSKTSNTKKK